MREARYAEPAPPRRPGTRPPPNRVHVKRIRRMNDHRSLPGTTRIVGTVVATGGGGKLRSVQRTAIILGLVAVLMFLRSRPRGGRASGGTSHRSDLRFDRTISRTRANSKRSSCATLPASNRPSVDSERRSAPRGAGLAVDVGGVAEGVVEAVHLRRFGVLHVSRRRHHRASSHRCVPGGPDDFFLKRPDLRRQPDVPHRRHRSPRAPAADRGDRNPFPAHTSLTSLDLQEGLWYNFGLVWNVDVEDARGPPRHGVRRPRWIDRRRGHGLTLITTPVFTRVADFRPSSLLLGLLPLPMLRAWFDLGEEHGRGQRTGRWAREHHLGRHGRRRGRLSVRHHLRPQR